MTAHLNPRRKLLRLLAAALAAGPAARLARPAAAGRSWCRTDPGLDIGGQEAHIYLYSDREMFAAATGPIRLVVTVPMGKEHKTKLLYRDDGFGLGYDLVIQASNDLKDSSVGIDVVVDGNAPASDSSLPVHLEVVPVSRGKSSTVAKGYANRWISARAKV